MNSNTAPKNNSGTNASSFISAPLTTVNNFATNTMNTVVNAANNFKNTVANVANNAVTNVANVAKNATNVVTNATNTVTNVASNVAKNATNAVTNVASNVAKNATNTINSVVSNTSNTGKNATSNTSTSLSSISSLAAPIIESANASLENDTSPFFTIPVIVTLGILVVLLILIVMFREGIAFGMSVAWEKAKKAFRSEPTPPVPVAPVVPGAPVIDKAAISKMLPGKKEVFNIANDKYTYTDAEPLCKAFGAELATYDQVKDAWNKGADWCNYGWVKGQAAVYPTQQASYDKLQAGPEDQRMSCGVPGVNGGYFDNPELRFGVNCYGSKPTENETDTRFLEEKKQNLTADALIYDKKVQDYKANMKQIPVNPFKTGSWSS